MFIYFPGFKGHSPLHCAAANGRLDIVKFILENVPVEINRKGYWTPLHLAIKFKHEKVVEFLLEQNADLNVQDDHNGAVPLHFAAVFGNIPIFKMIFEKTKDENMNPENRLGTTPMHEAARHNNYKIIELMVDRYSHFKWTDDAFEDNTGDTPLHYAAEFGHIKVCEVICHSLT